MEIPTARIHSHQGASLTSEALTNEVSANDPSLAGVGALGRYILEMSWTGIAWGDVATWVLDGITIAAVVAAARVIKIERGRDNQLFLSRVRSQASLVSAWVSKIEMTTADGRKYYLIKGVASNGSSQPVYDVIVSWYYKGGNSYRVDSVGLIPPNEKWDDQLKSEEYGKLLDKPGKKFGYSVLEAGDFAVHSRLSMFFTDAENRRWHRDPDGNLEQVHEAMSRHPSQRWARWDE